MDKPKLLRDHQRSSLQISHYSILLILSKAIYKSQLLSAIYHLAYVIGHLSYPDNISILSSCYAIRVGALWSQARAEMNWGGIFPSEVYEIRNYKWYMTLDFGSDEEWLSSIYQLLEKFWVVGGWIIALALLLFSLNWDFKYRNFSSEEQEPSLKIIIFNIWFGNS